MKPVIYSSLTQLSYIYLIPLAFTSLQCYPHCHHVRETVLNVRSIALMQHSEENVELKDISKYHANIFFYWK